VHELSALEAARWAGELEGPEEGGDLLEVGAGGGELVDDVLDRDDAVLAERLFDNLVVGERDALLVDLAISALEDELADGCILGSAHVVHPARRAHS
jgi:hypothetical protein